MHVVTQCAVPCEPHAVFAAATMVPLMLAGVCVSHRLHNTTSRHHVSDEGTSKVTCDDESSFAAGDFHPDDSTGAW